MTQSSDDPSLSSDAILNAGREVLSLEGNAILQMADDLNDDFIQAIDILKSIKGRVIVSGMGKSGHIGRKLAATLASTGTPAQYVHPGEASHGDLGMITPHDAIIALSNSGETRELSDLLEYSKRFSIPLIAITSRAKSTLARHASVALILPDREEADTLGLAPTTSTTVSLALGDALSVTLLQQKKFTAQDFHVFHPGGKLGAQLLQVADLMHQAPHLPLIDENASMQEALVVIAEKSFGCVGIQDESGHLVGIITDGDLRRHMSDTLLQAKAKDIMTAKPITADAKMMAMEVIRLMNEKLISVVFVLRDKKPVGIIHLHDFLRVGLS